MSPLKPLSWNNAMSDDGFDAFRRYPNRSSTTPTLSCVRRP
jgi:hypothetical protein